MGIWNPDQSGFWMVKKRLGFKWYLFGMGSVIRNPNHLKSIIPTIWNPDKWQPFCQKPFEIRTKMSGFQMVWFSNGWDNSYSHSLSPTIWKPDHLKSDLQKVRIANVLDFKWLDFRSPLYSEWFRQFLFLTHGHPNSTSYVTSSGASITSWYAAIWEFFLTRFIGK